MYLDLYNFALLKSYVTLTKPIENEGNQLQPLLFLHDIVKLFVYQKFLQHVPR